MTGSVEPSNSRAWPDEQIEALFAEGLAAFITAHLGAKMHRGRIREYFPHLDLLLVDESDDRKRPDGVPVSWLGDIEDLPTAVGDMLWRSVENHAEGVEAKIFVIGGRSRPPPTPRQWDGHGNPVRRLRRLH
jgi:hypothetical protein